MQNTLVFKMCLCTVFAVLMLSSWSCASGKNSRGAAADTKDFAARPAEPASTGSAQLDPGLSGREVTLRGEVFIAGSEPKVYTVFTSGGANYTVYPESVGIELAGYQGYLLEITGLLLDAAKPVPSLFPGTAVIAPQRWKIVQE